METTVWYLVDFFILYFIGTLIGYGLHLAIHQSWMGKFHVAHMNHHLQQYPLGNLLSKEYRKSGKDDTFFFFFLPIFFVIGIGLFFIMPFKYWLFAVIMMTLFGYAHEYFHTHFHLEDSWLLRFKFFHTLRKLHFIHHKYMQRNIGIYHFFWDRIFGTFVRKPQV